MQVDQKALEAAARKAGWYPAVGQPGKITRSDKRAQNGVFVDSWQKACEYDGLSPDPRPGAGDASGVTVKPLVWIAGDHDTHYAYPSLTEGYVVCRTGSRVTWRPLHIEGWRDAETLDAAKAAALADYEARILAALSAAATRGGAVRLRGGWSVLPERSRRAQRQGRRLHATRHPSRSGG